MEKRPRPWSPVELLDLATAYQRSKTLFALIEFALPTLLSRRALPLEEIASEIRIHLVAADRLLNACIALGLLEQRGLLSPREKHRNGAEWVFWAEEPKADDNK